MHLEAAQLKAQIHWAFLWCVNKLDIFRKREHHPSLNTAINWNLYWADTQRTLAIVCLTDWSLLIIIYKFYRKYESLRRKVWDLLTLLCGPSSNKKFHMTENDKYFSQYINELFLHPAKEVPSVKRVKESDWE